MKQTSQVAAEGEVFDCQCCGCETQEILCFYHDFPSRSRAIWLCRACNTKSWVIWKSVRAFMAEHVVDVVTGKIIGFNFPMFDAGTTKPAPPPPKAVQ